MNKDYYEILGITEEEKNLSSDEFKKILRKKFRELSLKWHPDKFSNESDEKKKDAEDKFKEINEAYETLKDDNKRQMYDLGGTEGMGMNMDPFEHFDPFGVFNHGNRNMVFKGEDASCTVEITLKEILEGTSKEAKYKVYEKCTHCNGTGAEKGKIHKCPYCNGTGKISERRETVFGISITERPCPHCNGSGTIIEETCHHCHGSGKEESIRTKMVNIPAGVFDGATIQMEGEGCAPVIPSGMNARGINGNLYVTFRIKPDDTFKIGYNRSNANLYCEKELPISTCLIGGNANIECLNGEEVNIVIPHLTKNGAVFRMKGKGLPDGYNGFGDLYVKIIYRTPKNLTDEQKKLLKKFDKIEDEK